MQLVSVKELSTFLHVKESTLYSWVHDGSIPFYKLNGLLRFDMEEIQQWVKDSKPTTLSATPYLPKNNNLDVNSIIKKAIDSVKGKGYNSSNGKPGQMQGLRKEV